MILVSPFAGGSYDPAIYGASGSFNGTDFVVTEGNFNNFNYYNSEFTVEAWIYTNTLVGVRSIIDSWYVPYQILLRTNGALLEAYLATNPSTGTAITVNYTLPATGTWYHVAVVRRYDSQRTIPSLVLELYVDGISRGTPVYNDTNLPGWFDWYYRIGVSWNGYISNVRIVKGTAVYTSNFTPPVLPLSNIAGTVLLTCQEWDTTNTFTSVSAGSSFSIAKLTNGRIYGWGLNNLNQIGNYAAQWRSVPSLINSGSWSQIAAGQSTGFGIKDNLLYGWGQNNLGQLGDNTVTNKAFPNIVQGINLATRSPTLVGSNFQTVSAGTSTTSAISNNSLFVWGLGTTGQIGIMSAVTRSSPTQVIGSWNKVFVGNSTLFAI
ncbi:MAG: LamG-like jellyroll fold domain-containing protein, partial [Dolichospermum sp.]